MKKAMKLLAIATALTLIINTYCASAPSKTTVSYAQNEWMVCYDDLNVREY